MTDQNLKELLADMSLREKIGQMLQLPAGIYLEPGSREAVTGPDSDMKLTDEDLDNAGSILGTWGPALDHIQKEQMAKQPHHIPMLFMLDVINGFRTVYPAPLGIGASFDPELARDCASMAANEAALSGVHVTFSPMADLCRDARWGRVMEGTGEDPYLNGLMAAAMVEGYQGSGMQKYGCGKICACIKHFAAYGAATAGRDYTAAQLSEHTLREFYLSGYKAAVDAGVGMVMTSFNTVDDIPATANRKLMRDILRKELGFDGVLISDYGAIRETIAHGYAADKEEAARKALEAGVDIDMCSDCYSAYLEQQVKNGGIDEKLIDEAVLRILTLKNRLGLFEHPYRYADSKKAEQYILCPENRALARKAARESFVLLKNRENILPIAADQGETIAFIGPYTDNRSMLSSWTIVGEEKDVVTIREAVQELEENGQTAGVAGADGNTTHFLFARGCPVIGRNETFYTYDNREAAALSDQDLARMEAEALNAAKRADRVVLCVGEHFLQSGESTSRTELLLPEVQLNLLRKVAEVNPNIVTVLFTGRPLDLREVKKYSKAILVVWFPGTEAGHAITDVLFGKEAPQGKLPMSFPYCTGQEPISYNEFSSGRPMPEGQHIRFFSGYLDAPNEPLYPFGYGLTYSEFRLSEAKLDRTVIHSGETARISAVLENTGKRKGTETVQLYIRDVAASCVRPVRELKGFRKVTLAPGESRTVEFSIGEEQLSFLRADGTVGTEPGEFRIFLGLSGADGKMTKLRLE